MHRTARMHGRHLGAVTIGMTVAAVVGITAGSAQDRGPYDRGLRQQTEQIDRQVIRGLGIASRAPGVPGRCARVARYGYQAGTRLRDVTAPGTGGMTFGELSAGTGEVIGGMGLKGYLKYCWDYWTK